MFIREPINMIFISVVFIDPSKNPSSFQLRLPIIFFFLILVRFILTHVSITVRYHWIDAISHEDVYTEDCGNSYQEK